MAVFLSPGVYPREIDVSVLPSSIGPLRPAFIGTAKKGPLNKPVLITNSAQYIDTFGEPFPESHLGYAVLAYLEEGNSCFVMRVGVECEDGQASELDSVCIDMSGTKGKGWGRIPLFKGIDIGRISLRKIGDGTGENPQPYVFHDSSISAAVFNDAELSTTDGPTTATLNYSGTYTGSIDDTYVLIITSPPDLSAGASVGGAEYQIIRNSDGIVVAQGTLQDDAADGTSQFIPVGSDGFSVQVVVTAGVLDTNDTFTWSVQPNNRVFSVSVDGGVANTYTMPVASYTTINDFITAANALLVGESYIFISYTDDDGNSYPQIVTTNDGSRIQLMSTEGFANEVGTQQYAYDIPRANLFAVDAETYNITSQNNRVKINVVGDTETKVVEFSLPTGLNQTAAALASVIDGAGYSGGVKVWQSYALTAPGGTVHLVIETTSNNELDALEMEANFSNIKTLRFAEELNILYPYKGAYRGFWDNRATLPSSGSTDPATPASCETNPLSAQCLADSNYFKNIVGWFIAPTPGTWIDDFTVTVTSFTEGYGELAGRFNVIIYGKDGEVVENISDITFDKRDDRYIGNVINPGTKYGGTNGNAYINWEERPAFLNNDTNLTTYEVRNPSQFNNREFIGAANGIPTDPAFSSELDSAVIGNPLLATGLYAFQNPESIDINLLITPGFSSGPVVGTALQVCESRGDVLYIVDPPFGLRPQQVVDWHNGILTSNLSSAINSSYGALYWGWGRSFDLFNSIEVWVPPSGHVSAVYSRTARDAEMWFAPAGLRRGRLRTLLDIEYSPTKGERDLLYGSGNAVNPIVKFPQEGIVVWGQRTLQRTPSALDRVNVRMLMSYLKKNLIQLLRNFVFEPNDRTLWAQVESAITPFLSDVQARRGLQAFKVIVDETNNTPERIDRGELWVSVLVVPTRAVEFVVLNIAVLRSGGAFAADEVLAAAGINIQS